MTILFQINLSEKPIYIEEIYLFTKHVFHVYLKPAPDIIIQLKCYFILKTITRKKLT